MGKMKEFTDIGNRIVDRNSDRVSEITLSGLLLILGGLFSAIGLQLFLIPNMLIDGGILGISMLSTHFFHIPVGVFILVLNLPFLIIKLKKKKYIYNILNKNIVLINTLTLKRAFKTLRFFTKSKKTGSAMCLHISGSVFDEIAKKVELKRTLLKPSKRCFFIRNRLRPFWQDSNTSALFLNKLFYVPAWYK